MPADWTRVTEIVDAALSRPPNERDAFVETACAGDEALKADVRSLVDAHEQSGGFLDQPALRLAEELLPPSDALVPGQHLGPYRIESELGRGNMGVVYCAEDQRLGRKVALKAIVPESTGDPQRRKRFEMEARAAAALSHPGVATVYALDEIDGQLYLAHELVQGDTLRDLMQHRRLPIEQLLDIAAQVARGISAAHAAGVVHRDLKPENIIVSPNGTAKILDFGIARVATPMVEEGKRLTGPGAIVGTPAYMAPEQLEGGDVDGRADIFALGVVLYEATSGTNPFEGRTAISTAMRIRSHHPPPLQALNPLVPPALDRIVRRCLHKQPSRRYQSAGDVASDLEALRRLSQPAGARDEHDEPSAPGLSYRAVWRVHQVGVMLVYAALVYPAWLATKWTAAWWMMPVFFGAVIMASVNGVLRTHLLFTERFNRPAVLAELRRKAPWVRASDVAYGALLLAAALPIAWTATVTAGVLASFGIGAVVTALLVEPSTTRSAFGRKVSSGARKPPRDRSSR